MAFGTLAVSWGATGPGGADGKAPTTASSGRAEGTVKASKGTGGRPTDGAQDGSTPQPGRRTPAGRDGQVTPGGGRGTPQNPGGGQSDPPGGNNGGGQTTAPGGNNGGQSDPPGGNNGGNQNDPPGGNNGGGQTAAPGGNNGGGQTAAPGGQGTRPPASRGPVDQETDDPTPTDPPTDDPGQGSPGQQTTQAPDPGQGNNGGGNNGGGNNGGNNGGGNNGGGAQTQNPPAPAPQPVTQSPSGGSGNRGGTGQTGGSGSATAPATGAAAAPGVLVTTEDIALTSAYWNAPNKVAELRVTVANPKPVTQLVTISYTLPDGLTDAGTTDCAASGQRTFTCKAWSVSSAGRGTARIRVRVAGDAWQKIPLNGVVRASATIPGSGQPAVVDQQGFAVLFPAGPPVPGVSLWASGVSFDITGQPTTLEVQLGNTGQTDATGSVEVILPDGVGVQTPPAGCSSISAARTRCDLGTIAAGRNGGVRLPVTASAESQRIAPLSGAVFGTLTPLSGTAKRVQMSFRIDAIAATAGGTPGPAPTGSQGAIAVAERSDESSLVHTGGTALTLVVVSILLVLLALMLAMASLRRGLRARAAERDGSADPRTPVRATAPAPTALAAGAGAPVTLPASPVEPVI
jgi:hypothetical protein